MGTVEVYVNVRMRIKIYTYERFSISNTLSKIHLNNLFWYNCYMFNNLKCFYLLFLDCYDQNILRTQMYEINHCARHSYWCQTVARILTPIGSPNRFHNIPSYKFNNILFYRRLTNRITRLTVRQV